MTSLAQTCRASAGLKTTSSQSQSSAAPETPKRTVSTASDFASPATLARDNDDCLVFEFGSRYFRAGFSNEWAPRCCLGFGPEEQRRMGDYRQWEAGYETQWRKRKRGKDWGEVYELWRPDLRGLDLGLIGDKVERVVRDAYHRYLMHAQPRKLMLILQPTFPHPLLSTLLSTLFTNFQLPSVSLMSSPVLATVGAGLRSALIVDIGWHETVITGVYELREVLHRRTDRAGKMLSREMGKMLARESIKAQEWHEAKDTIAREEEDFSDDISFEEVEEVLTRIASCKSYKEALRNRRSSSEEGEDDFEDASEEPGSMPISEDQDGSTPSAASLVDPIFSVPLRSTSPRMTLQLPMSRFSEPCETALFASGIGRNEAWDDNEIPVHHLAYHTLLSLPTDARGMCMSRIVVTGGCSNLPGIKNRIVEEVSGLYAQHGWDKVRGKAAERRRDKLEEINRNMQASNKLHLVEKISDNPDDDSSATISATSAALEVPQADFVEEKLRKANSPNVKPVVRGVVRGVETLGAWVGGSLLGTVRVKSIAQIEQDRFLQHGLAGASREAEVGMVAQKFSVGPTGPRGGAGERSSWTLGAFA